MITTDELLARMRNGETADDIANEMAQMLNMAERELAKEHNANSKENAFKRACEDAAVAMNDALDAYAHWKGIDVSKLGWDADMCSDIIEVVVNLDNLLDAFNIMTKSKNTDKKKSSGDDDFDAVVEKFLQMNHID